MVNKLFDDSSARLKGPEPHTANSQIVNKSSTQLSTNSVQTVVNTRRPQRTELQRCVDAELTKYFAMLENDPPKDLYQLVMSQVESAVINYVLDVCGNNQSRAAVYLGISRGKLRSRIKELSL